jgi:hypothetical protein
MAIENINIGSAPNDGTGDTIRDAFDQCNGNFTDLDTSKFDTPSGTDIQYVKGDGTLGTFDIPAILNQGNRPIKIVEDTTYTFVSEDKGKYIILASTTTVVLNIGVFNITDSLVVYNGTGTDITITGSATLIDNQLLVNASMSFITKVASDDTWTFNCIHFRLTTTTELGLENVDNTSDLDKPISTATQDALDLKEDLSNKTNTVIGNETNTNKYLSVKGYYDYLVQMVEWLTPEAFATFVIYLTQDTTPHDVDMVPIIISGVTTTQYVRLDTLRTYFMSAVPTTTSGFTNNGSDGLNPFITALDIPTAGQAGTLVREVKNMTGGTLVKGTVVYISGANGNKALVSKAKADAESTSARTFGLLQSDILNNGTGYCVVIGDISGLDTSAFTEGAQLYLSGTTAGTYTSTKTLAPTHLVYIGKVTRSHPTQGQIEVQIQNGYELDEIHDVSIVSKTNNDVLQYESATSLWKNKALTTVSVSASTDKNYVTDAQAIVIGNTSGTNTGDNATNSQYSGLASSKEDTVNKSTSVSTDQSSNVKFPSVKSVYDWATGLFATKSMGAYTFRVNNTNATANSTETTYKALGKQTLSTTFFTWTGTTAPSGTATASYNYTQMGNIVTVNVKILYTVAGTLITALSIPFPSDLPTPIQPTGFTISNEKLYIGVGQLSTSKTVISGTMGTSAIRNNNANNGFEFVIAGASANVITLEATLTYFTS